VTRSTSSKLFQSIDLAAPRGYKYCNRSAKKRKQSRGKKKRCRGWSELSRM